MTTPEFELGLTNVESEVVDGVTVIKSFDLTEVSLNLEPLAERPPMEYIANGYLRRCGSCGHSQVAHVGVTAEVQHVCHRGDVTYLVLWPRG